MLPFMKKVRSTQKAVAEAVAFNAQSQPTHEERGVGVDEVNHDVRSTKVRLMGYASVGNNQGFTVGVDQSGHLMSMYSSSLMGSIHGPLMFGLHPAWRGRLPNARC